MAQQLSALAVPPEDPGSILPHMWQALSTIFNSKHRVDLVPPLASISTVCTWYPDMHAGKKYIYIKFKRISRIYNSAKSF